MYMYDMQMRMGRYGRSTLYDGDDAYRETAGSFLYTLQILLLEAAQTLRGLRLRARLRSISRSGTAFSSAIITNDIPYLNNQLRNQNSSGCMGRLYDTTAYTSSILKEK